MLFFGKQLTEENKMIYTRDCKEMYESYLGWFLMQYVGVFYVKGDSMPNTLYDSG